MLNMLDHYISHSMPEWGDFKTNANLEKKVGPRGEFLPYIGNTAVFLLDEKTKLRLTDIQEALYKAAPDMLAEKLDASTFHMTLHDLANGTPNQPDVRGRMCETERLAAGIISPWKTQEPLHLKTTWLFNMVNTSIVLGLAPANEDTWYRLDEMYTRLETVVQLGYALTPHITMAYFRPGTYDPSQIRRLSAELRKIDLDIMLLPENLVLQNFTDMNHYETVL